LLVIVAVKEDEALVDADMEGDSVIVTELLPVREGVNDPVLLVVGVIEGVRDGLGRGGS
jgi:hypothetical protein